MSIVIQSHHYTINFDNVNYFRTHNDIKGLTVFKMNNGRSVLITCPYDEVVAHLKSWTNITHSSRNTLIELKYGDDLANGSKSDIEKTMEDIASDIAAVARN